LIFQAAASHPFQFILTSLLIQSLKYEQTVSPAPLPPRWFPQLKSDDRRAGSEVILFFSRIRQHGLETQMKRMQLSNPVSSPANAQTADAGAATAARGAVALSAGPSPVTATSQAGSPTVCGVGIRFAETTSGEFKITQLVPDRSAGGFVSSVAQRSTSIPAYSL
jgi:hypothetical protein